MTTAQLIHAAAMLVETSADFTADEFAERLASFIEESTDKIAALRAVCKAAEGRAASCKAESALYATAAKAHTNTAERTLARAYLLMEAAEHAGETLTGARLQPNSAAPLLYAPDFDATALPFDMQRVKVEPNSAAIAAALERGEVVPGVTMGVRGRHLRWTESK